MPNYRQPDPTAATNAFARQVQLGANMRANDQSEQMNAFALAQAQREDDAAKQPKYDPQAFQKVGAITSQISTIADPVQKRQAFKVALTQNAPLFQTLGVPADQAAAKLDQTDDATLDDLLAKLSAHAPKAAPQKLGAGDSLVSQRQDGTYGADFTAPAKPAGEADGFTLSEGQQRFDANGKPIARVAPRPDKADEGARNTQLGQLRDDFRNDSKVFVGAADAFQRLNDSATDPSGAGDVALLYNYLKVLDPASTVREGEFQMVGSSGGLPTQVQAYFSKMQNGKLPDSLRSDIVNRAERLYKGQEQRYKTQILDRYRGLYKRAGGDPNDIGDQSVTQPPTQQQAPPGAIQYLQQHPEAAQAFQQKYGYLPQ